MLIGLGKMVKKITSNLNLLASKILGFSYAGGGGSSYYTTTVGSLSPAFVIAQNGFSRYSTDGTTWVQNPTGPNQQYYNIVYGNNVFVGASFLKLCYSLDGINWTENSLGYYFHKVFYIDNRFFAVGEKVIAMSTDGITWVTVSNAGTYTDMVLAAGKLVLVGNGMTAYGYAADDYALVENLALGGNANFTSVEYANGKFVAVGSDPNAYYLTSYSTDGINWTHNSLSGMQSQAVGPLTSLQYGNNVFVAAGSWQTAYSTDGVNWTIVDMNVYSRKIIYANNVFVSIGNNGAAYSTNGANWTTVVGQNLFDDAYWDIIYANNMFVATGSYRIANSVDGINWTQQSGGNYYTVIAYGNVSTLKEIQVAIGNQGQQGAEILAPVDVYTVPSGKTTAISSITVKNTSTSNITYDLAVLDSGISLTDQNALINDYSVLAGATDTVTSIATPMTAGQRIVVLPSTVDVVEVKVYGTES